jgi:hypothetical protein
VAVPEAVRRQPVLDRQPAGRRRVAGGLLAAAWAVTGLVLVGDDPPVEPQPDRVPASLARSLPSMFAARPSVRARRVKLACRSCGRVAAFVDEDPVGARFERYPACDC